MDGQLILALGALFALLVLGLLVWITARLRRTGLDRVDLTAQVAASLRQAGLQEDLGRLQQMAADMARTTQELSRVFQVHQQRGALGELQLESILADQVPRDRLRIRQNVPLVGTPDAALETRDGLLCIDSKFPLDKYRELVATPEAQRDAPAKAFLRAVRAHLDTVQHKYVRPDAGTLPYAMAYIPSEAVYTFLHQAEPGLASEYARRGVLLASPSTLTTHAALLVLGIRADALSERAKLVQEALARLDRNFASVAEAWETLRRHLKNAGDQAAKVEQALDGLDAAYRQARSLEIRDKP